MANHESKLLIGAASLLLSCALGAQNTRPQVRVDTSPVGTLNFDPVVASSGDLSVVAYAEGTDIYAVSSDGQGLNWSAPVRVDGDVTGGRKDLAEGDVAIVGNNVYILWKDERSGATTDELYFNYSTDGGATFVGEQLINKTTPAGTGAIRGWKLAATPNGALDAVYVAFEVDPTGGANEELYIVASVDGGATFGAPVHVPQGVAAGIADPDGFAIAADGPIVHVAWVDNRGGEDDAFFNQSFDNGATFSADIQLDTSVGGDVEGAPQLAINGNTIAVAWQEERPNGSPEELRGAVSIDLGATFGSDLLIGNYAATIDDVDNHRVGVTSNGVVVAAWEDNRGGSDDIYAATSTDGGVSWNSDTAVSTGGAGFPRLIEGTDGCDVIVWTSGSFPNTAEAAISYDSGASWQPQVSVSQNTGDVDFAEVAYNDLYGNFIAAWLSDDTTANDVYVGGFREANVTAVGWSDIYNPANPTLQFDCIGFGSDTTAIIGLSAGTGPVPTADGRLFGLGPSIGPFGGPGFQAPLIMGAGSSIALPNIFAGGGPAAGINVFFAGAGFSAAGLGKLTDTFSFQL